jgi:hypothetical protein
MKNNIITKIRRKEKKKKETIDFLSIKSTTGLPSA